MKNIHELFSNWNQSQVKILGKFGVKAEQGYFSFSLEENDIYWQLKPYLDEWGVEETVISLFSHEDLENANMLIYAGVWTNGYPMLDVDNEYQQTTYDNTNYCNICGMGLVQKEPFRLKKSPNWSSKRRLFSLNWVFDELFVRKDLYEALFEPIGIGCENVLLYKKETVIEDTVQLLIPETEIPLNLESYPFETCNNCGRKRYDLIREGFFPSLKFEPEYQNIFKSREWFGTGANARKYIFFSQAMRQDLEKAKVGMKFIPCKNSY